MPRKFGTKAFGGLSTKAAPHLIEDGELQACQNADFDEAGAVKPLADDTSVVSGSGDAQGLSVVQRAGSPETWARMGGTTYRNGSAVSGISGTATMRVVSDGENAYIVDGDANKVFDGEVVRPHGAFVPSDTESYNSVIIVKSMDSPTRTITGITNAKPCVVTTSSAHGLSVGDYVGIDDAVQGMTEIAGAAYRVNGVPSSTQIELGDPDTEEDIDSTSYGTYTSGGSIVDNPCMLDGDYIYACSYVMTYFPSSGAKRIESGLYRLSNFAAYASDETVVTLRPWYRVQYTATVFSDSETHAYIDSSYSPYVAARFYRTKAGGSTFYRTNKEAIVDTGGTGGLGFFESTKDSDLGAAWLYDEDAGGDPPSGNLACIVQQRMFMAGVDGEEGNLYFSGISKYDWFKPTDYIDVEDRITAIAPIGDRVAVFTAGRIGTYAPIDAIGQFAWSYSPVGTDMPDSVEPIEGGILFARDDGLWLFDGHTSVRLTDKIEDSWRAISGQWSVAATPRKIVCSCSGGAFVASRVGDDVLWSKLSSTVGSFVASSPDDVTIYAMNEGASSTDVSALFSGSGQRSLELTSKDFGGGQVYDALMLMVDAAAGGNNFTVTVTSNFGDAESVTFTCKSNRFRYITMLPRGLRGEFFNIKVSGQVTLYGVELTVR